MERSDGDHDAGAGEDRLSALPDDLLLLILLRLNYAMGTAAATRTSVLSRRWRRVWALLPEIQFRFHPKPSRLTSALAAHEADLRSLHVLTRDSTPESVAAWLPIAARRLSGRLVFDNWGFGKDSEDEDEDAAAGRGAVDLPCFERATALSLNLGDLSVTVPPAGVFARLTELSLSCVRFDGPCELGDAVSSPRCPYLRRLAVSDAWGLDNLTIRSGSLMRLELGELIGMLQLTVVAPALEELTVRYCFLADQTQPVATISAAQLLKLEWLDAFDPSTVQLGKMEHLQFLGAYKFCVYGDEDDEDGFAHNNSCLSLLQRFKVIRSLCLTLTYTREIDDYQYLMEDMTMFPDITCLHLVVMANGHAFGASSFHVLRMCTGIRRLVLKLTASPYSKEQPACSSGCICDQQQPPNWKTDELKLNHLKEVEICGLRGSENEVSFLKRLFNWATMLKKVIVTFDYFATKSKAKECYQLFPSYAKPEICFEFYISFGSFKVPYSVDEDEGSGWCLPRLTSGSHPNS